MAIMKPDIALASHQRTKHQNQQNVKLFALSATSPLSIWRVAGGEAQKKATTFICILFLTLTIHAQSIITDKVTAGAFPIVTTTTTATIVVDSREDSLVHIAARLLAEDIEKVTGRKPDIRPSLGLSKHAIIIGNSNKSAFIRQLVKNKKLAIAGLQNQWEGYRINNVNAPFKGVAQALVIAGSDRRGTAYGVMELSKQIGVSPWWWWADVPVKKAETILVKPNTLLADAPRVKYRGIFINDEAPALSSWSKEKFGGFNHRFYEKVFELILRQKGNYLWPAMWGNAFYDDDPLNLQTADNWGIVIGTSHHEPLMRAHDEWRRHGSGKWDYGINASALQQFWRQGMQRATNEKIVTVGMRGDGDEPMSRETATALLEKIVTDQRQIIEDVTGKPAPETPQLWALYKEVQDYYDKGMRVPDDVTLLISDDNWGNIRRLPALNEPKRKGGYGIYYHFDYVGGPRNYKWLNTNNIPRVWEQMNLAWRYGADRIWIVNVGDIKPMELPISFFLDHAWNPEKWNTDNLRNYYTKWAADQFGSEQAGAIGDILRRYAQYSARRKPELLDAATYRISPFADDDEGGRVLNEWNELYADAAKVSAALPAADRDAFFQVALHPIKALRNLHQLYNAVAWNQYYAKQKNPAANAFADRAKAHYHQDSLITMEYHQMAGGKWNGMMSQTHTGYTYWQQPPVNKMPAVTYVESGEDKPLEERATRSAKEAVPASIKTAAFYEKDGVVAMEAEHWTKATGQKNVQWKVIPDIGRTGSGITTFPVTASVPLSATSPNVAYDFYTYSTGPVTVHLYFSPTLNLHNHREGLQFAISVDDEAPQVFSLNNEDKNTGGGGIWNKWVAENIIIRPSKHTLAKPGKHTLRYWMISPAVILQKAVVDLGGLKQTYLGPVETKAN